MTGAMAILNIGQYNTFVKPVILHEPGTNNFTYDDDFGNILFKAKNGQYYLDSSLELLDNPGEWHYTQNSKMLRFMPLDGECPPGDSNRIRGRTIDYAIDTSNTDGITIANMTFFASNVYSESKNIHLDSLNFLFPSSSKRMLGSFQLPKWTQLKGKCNISIIRVF